MAANTVTRCAAEMLATFVDETFAERWTGAGATLAYSGVEERRLGVTLVPFGQDPVQALRMTPTAACVAACLTSLGTAVRLDIPSAEHLTVRATVAVSRCGSITVLRHRDGRIEHSTHSEGAIIELLRAWADLLQCPVCASEDEREKRP